jgi:hypothetical protein
MCQFDFVKSDFMLWSFERVAKAFPFGGFNGANHYENHEESSKEKGHKKENEKWK